MRDVKIGIDLGGSHVSIGVVDSNYNIIEQHEKDFTIEEKKNIMEVAIEYIVNTLNLLKSKYNFSTFGIGMAGIIKDGIVIQSPNIGVKNFNIKEFLKEKTGLDAKIDNDAICAAMGEYAYSNLNQYNKIIFLTLGTGIGGNVILNGKIIDDPRYQELGHTIIKENGIQCKCGKKGCFERYGSILVFKNKVIERLGLDYDISGPELREQIKLHIDEVRDIIEQYINDLSQGITILINKFNPDIVVIGGGFARYDYLFTSELRKEIFNSLPLENKEVIIETAKSGNDAGIIGASLL